MVIGSPGGCKRSRARDTPPPLKYRAKEYDCAGSTAEYACLQEGWQKQCVSGDSSQNELGVQFIWTIEKLSSLEPARLEILRQNASSKGDTDLATLCETLQKSRRSIRATGPREKGSPVIGFHFVCKDDYEVTVQSDGTFRSGVWAVDQNLCDPAILLGGYVALHNTELEPSYRQGRIVGWQTKDRSKGTTATGVEFVLEPMDKPFRWYGKGSGERGYRRVGDEPGWKPPS
jgi:hypothetical protein